MNGVKIKLCGLCRIQDSQAVNEAMPDYAGFVFYEKSRRNVPPELAQKLRVSLRQEIQTVGVFVDVPPAMIARLYEEGIITIAQLHGAEDSAYIAALRRICPVMEIWKAFQVRTAKDLAAAAKSTADSVLLDNGAGTGKPFDWSLAEHIVRPFILAGGLTPETIQKAIAGLRPYAIDLSSGIETNGVKDGTKIREAVDAARRAKAG